MLSEVIATDGPQYEIHHGNSPNNVVNLQLLRCSGDRQALRPNQGRATVDDERVASDVTRMVRQEKSHCVPFRKSRGQAAYDSNLESARLAIRSKRANFCPTSAPLPPCSSHTMMVRCVQSSRKEGR
jgi:hypothetical protein